MLNLRDILIHVKNILGKNFISQNKSGELFTKIKFLTGIRNFVLQSSTGEERWTHADKRVSVMNLHQQSESWSSQCLTWDTPVIRWQRELDRDRVRDQFWNGPGHRPASGDGRLGAAALPDLLRPPQPRHQDHAVRETPDLRYGDDLMMSPRRSHDVTTPTSWCHMFLSQSCKCVSDFVCLLCVSLCRQQPREDVDGDPLQRDDLHPAGLHAAHLLQDPQPGRRGRTRRLQRRDGDRWGLFWLVHWWGQSAALWFCDSMFTRGSVVRMMSRGQRSPGQRSHADCVLCSGPYGERDDQQVFIQRVVPDTDKLYVRLSSNGKRWDMERGGLHVDRVTDWVQSDVEINI